MTDAPLLLKIEPPLAWLTVNRPAARNALTMAVWDGLASHMRELADQGDVRVVIIRGAGDESFISGADITEFPAARKDAGMTAEYDRRTHATLEAIATLSKPVIAMINGLCFGGGCSVALACDLRFAAQHSRFAIPAARLGLAYPFHNGIESLVRIVGPTHAADLLLSTRAISASDALRIGLLNGVVPGTQLETTVREYAEKLADNAPLTLAAHKIAIREAMRPAPERDITRIQSLARQCFDSNDYQEGIAAFLAKRKPVFQGR